MKRFFLTLAFLAAVHGAWAGGPEPTVTFSDILGTVGVTQGGTGATSAYAASANLLGTALKVKKLTGTTSGSVGGSATVAHGLTRAKIVAFMTLVDDGTNLVLPFFRSGSNIVYDTYIDATNVNIDLRAADSSLLTSKGFIVLIWYQE